MTGSATTAAIAPLLRDEVFRIETPRMWLRWPVVADAEAIQVAAARKCVAEMTGTWPHPLPAGAAAQRITVIRETNPTGRGLSLVLTRKVNPARAIGLVGVRDAGDGHLGLGYLLDSASHGRGLMSEALAALVFSLFSYGPPTAIEAKARPGNAASCRVLTKTGFVEQGSTVVEAPARGGPIEVIAYRLSRADWRAHVTRTRAAAAGLLEEEARVA